jgi:hypothetical protein
MGRGPSRFGRTTPLPRTGRRSHLRVTPQWARDENQRAGLDEIKVRVTPAIHPSCKASLADLGYGCARCEWLTGEDTDQSRWFDFWVDKGA